MTLSWSVSRDQVLHICERRYYFQYIVQARIDSRNRTFKEIAFLKKLKNLYSWKGELLHTIVADYLKRISQGQSIQIDKFLDNYKENIKLQWGHSLKKEYKSNLNGTVLALLEHEYGEYLPDTALQDVIQNIEKWFMLFHNWESTDGIYEKLKRARRFWIEPQPYGPKAPSFNFDGVQVLAKVDLAIQNNDGSFDIYDWKSSPAPTRPAWNIEHGELQVSVYQLWPHLQFNVPLRLIQAHVVYIGGNPIAHNIFHMDGNKKEYILNLIGRSVDKVKHFADLHSKKQLSIRDFDFAAHTSTCRLCAFKRLCQRELII